MRIQAKRSFCNLVGPVHIPSNAPVLTYFIFKKLFRYKTNFFYSASNVYNYSDKKALKILTQNILNIFLRGEHSNLPNELYRFNSCLVKLSDN